MQVSVRNVAVAAVLTTVVLVYGERAGAVCEQELAEESDELALHRDALLRGLGGALAGK